VGGTVSPGLATVGYGGGQTFIIQPDEGYYITNVSVDGVSKGAMVTYSFSSVTAAHTIQASFAINTYSITTNAGTGGTISPSSAALNYLGVQTFEIVPTPGYSISNIKVDGVSLGPMTSYTFVNVSANHNLSATFTQTPAPNPVLNPRTTLSYPSLTAAYNDTATQNGDRLLAQNVTLVENFTSSRGISVTIDGGYLPGFTTHSGMTTLQGAADINTGNITWMNFMIGGETFTITAYAGENGSISPAGATVNYGGNQTFNMVPNAGYSVADVQVDGADQGKITSYTFNNVTAPHVITATFSPNTYAITPSSGQNGSILPLNDSVGYDAGQTFAIVPNAGYYVSDVVVDGVDQGAITSYTFDDVTGSAHTISATFSQSGVVKNSRTGQLYTSIGAAYQDAQNGDTILAQNVQLIESFAANRNVSVTIDGGYLADFITHSGVTTIKGAEVIGNGVVTWKNFEISN
jgi:hypothetical protein